VTGTSAEPGSAEEYARRGFHLARIGRWLEASVYLQRAVELDERQTIAWCNLGAVMRSLGRVDAALRCFERALTVDPANTTARWNAMSLHATEGRTKPRWFLLASCTEPNEIR
jgi:tetratricopeptide (TPR) repeat protein